MGAKIDYNPSTMMQPTTPVPKIVTEQQFGVKLPASVVAEKAK